MVGVSPYGEEGTRRRRKRRKRKRRRRRSGPVCDSDRGNILQTKGTALDNHLQPLITVTNRRQAHIIAAATHHLGGNGGKIGELESISDSEEEEPAAPELRLVITAGSSKRAVLLILGLLSFEGITVIV